MEAALLVAGAILASETLLRLPLMQQVNAVVGTARRAAGTMRSKRISDHWKEIALPAYSLRIAARSVFFFLLLCLVALPVGLIGGIAPGGMARWLERLMQPFAISILSVSSVLYIFVRTRFARD